MFGSGTGFGAASSTTSVFGSSSTAPAFGGPSTGVFGSSNPAPSPFGGFAGASSTAFGAFSSSTAGPSFGFSNPAHSTYNLNQSSGFGSTIGASSGGVFGNKPNFFGSSSSGSGFGFGSSSGVFGTSSSGAFGGWGTQPQQQGYPGQSASTKEQHEFQQMLCRRDGRPLTPHAKFRDLQDGGQNVLHKMEQEIGTSQKLGEQLKEHDRLGDENQFQKEFTAKVSRISQGIGVTKRLVDSDQKKLEELRPMEEWLHAATRHAAALSQRGQIWKKSKEGSIAQNSLPFAHKDLQSFAELPDRHLLQGVQELQESAQKLSNWVSDLEAAVGAEQSGEDCAKSSDLEPALKNMHAFFIHVASKIEKLYGEVNKAKSDYLRFLERQGIPGDPFEEADKEIERRESVQKKPTPSQMRTQYITPSLPLPMQPNMAQPQQQPAASGPQLGWGGALGASSGASGGGLFGAQAGPSFGAGLFGSQSSSSSVFGAASSGGLFGQSSSAFGGGGVFGQSSGGFGGGGAFGAASSGGGLWGQSGFSSGGVFGQSSSGAFGGSGSGGGIFGQASSGALGFGSGNTGFGQSSGAGTSLFGPNPGAGAGNTQFGQSSTSTIGPTGGWGSGMYLTPQRNNKNKSGRRR